MKNLKKVLALVMAFAMAFTMFAGAVAFEDVELGSDYSAAISMLSDLEVVSGNGKGAYEPAKAVTRAEMCVLIANMMNGGKADTARFAGGSNFSDVAHGWWGESAIAYCVQNGITYGVGGGKFAPNREITDAEAVAMLTRAMGYDTAANPLSFPYGNYTAAVNNGIVDNIPYVEGSACTKGEAAQMIYDCLFADYARLTANLNVIHNADDHDDVATLIEDVFGLVRASDKDKADDKCTQHKWVIVAKSCEDEDVIWAAPVDDKTNEIEGAAEKFDCTADVSALIGYEVALWGEDEHASANDKDGEIDVVKAVEVLDGQVAYDYNPTMADSKPTNDKLADFDDLKVEEGVEEWMNTKNGNSYVLFDWDNDGDVDYINDTQRYYGEIETLTSKKVIVEIGTKTYTLDLADGETDEYEDYCFDGVEDHDYVVELDAEEGDVVEITVDDAYESTLTITITAVEPAEKEFTKLDAKGNMYFDGEKMEQAETRFIDDDADDLAKADTEEKFDIWTNANGYIIKCDPVGASSDGYLMLVGVEDGVKKSVSSRSTKAVVEVLFTDGTSDELDVAFDAEIENAYDDETYKFDLSNGYQGGTIIGGVFEYTLDDDGCIEKMEMVDDRFDAYTFTDKYDEIEYWNKGVKTNTIKFTGSDFVFVVDDDYVDADAVNGIQEVDTDLVAILTMDELEDIDASATAKDGAYYSDAAVLCGLSSEDQTKSDDYADGAVLVVADLADYLGTKTHAVGAITNIEVSGKGVYTFYMNEDESYSTGKTDKEKTLFAGDEVVISEDDDKIVEEIANATRKVKPDLLEKYGNVLYADLTIRDGEVIAVELLVKYVDGMMTLKSEKELVGDYRVIRGVVDRESEDGDELRVIHGAEAASDKTIATMNEYMDRSNKKFFDLTSDTVVWDVDDVPGMIAGVDLNDNIAYTDDADITSGGKINESIWGAKIETDILYVVDVIYDYTEGDLNGEAVAVYAFEDVEDDDKYVAPIEYTLTADTTVASSVAAHLFADGEQVAKADVDKIADASFAVYVKREKADQSDVSDEGEMEWVKLEIENVKSLNDKGDMGIFFKTGSALANGETAYVVLEGAMGDVDLDVVSSQIDIEIK